MQKPKPSCKSHDPELWFPIGDGPPAQAQAIRAKAICANCLLVEACLAYAVSCGIEFGVWGGQTEHERRATRRRMPVTRKGYGDVEARETLVRALASQA